MWHLNFIPNVEWSKYHDYNIMTTSLQAHSNQNLHGLSDTKRSRHFGFSEKDGMGICLNHGEGGLSLSQLLVYIFQKHRRLSWAWAKVKIKILAKL